MNLELIEQQLKLGQTPPPLLADYKDWLSAEASSLMDRQAELTILFSDWFFENRKDHKSDKACQIAWYTKDEGREQLLLETRQRKIKTLREAISSHLRIASDMARNLF